MVATMSTTWKRPCLRLKMPFWPVIMTIGIAPSNAKAAPVVRLSAPWTKRCKADAGPTSQPPLRGRHERGGLLMARHNELDARPAKRPR